MNNKIKNKNLKSELILNKKFATALSGYEVKEVDDYLDLILKDIRQYEEETKLLVKSNGELENIINDKKDNIEKLKIEINSLKLQVEKLSENKDQAIMKELNIIKRQLANNKDEF
jgi:DivIVA domain-containing protein